MNAGVSTRRSGLRRVNFQCRRSSTKPETETWLPPIPNKQLMDNTCYVKTKLAPWPLPIESSGSGRPADSWYRVTNVLSSVNHSESLEQVHSFSAHDDSNTFGLARTGPVSIYLRLQCVGRWPNQTHVVLSNRDGASYAIGLMRSKSLALMLNRNKS